MNFFNDLQVCIKVALEVMIGDGTLPGDLDLGAVSVEPPRDPDHGDVATNCALVLAKAAKMKPRDIAGLLATHLEEAEDVISAQVAGPGFLNLRMTAGFWHDRLAEALTEGANFGRSNLGASAGKVNVEFVSANPTGPMHIGHARGAVFGDALASLLEFSGHDVIREFYVNDAGEQVDTLARSVHLRYREALGEDIGEIPSGLYPGEYLKSVGGDWPKSRAAHGRRRRRMRGLGTWALSGRISQIGGPGTGRNPGGADHGGYIKRMKAVVKALAGDDVELDVKICQMVKLLRGGTPVKMSKHSGDFVSLREVVDEVGKDVVRFIMLTRRNDAPLEFDFDVVTEQSRDNPVFYVQYAHARCWSVLKKAREAMPNADLSAAALANADLSRLTHPGELALMKSLAGWPRTVESAALAHEPHRIAFYLRDLASHFHALWTKGKEDGSLRFLIDGDEALTLARLALVRGCMTGLACGLGIIGVTPVEELR